MYTGKLVFSQVMEHLPLHVFHQCVDRYNGNFKVKVKDNNQSVGDGMQQGLEHATTLDVPFVFSSICTNLLFEKGTPTEEAATQCSAK